MKREYKVAKHNSTVNGYPGRLYDWSKFCWDGSDLHVDRCPTPGHPETPIRAPLPYVDSFLIAPGCQYLHVPYDWSRWQTIYRVRPNDSMYAGETYRGAKVRRQTVALHDDGWYWVLALEP